MFQTYLNSFTFLSQSQDSIKTMDLLQIFYLRMWAAQIQVFLRKHSKHLLALQDLASLEKALKMEAHPVWRLNSQNQIKIMRSFLKLIPLFLIILLTGCGIGVQTPSSIDAEFQPYMDQFVKNASQQKKAIQVNSLVIKFGSTNGIDSVGECNKGFNEERTIIIDKSYWEQSDTTERLILIFHELGHCVLNRSHIPGNAPISIMFPYLISEETFNWKGSSYYISELFNNYNAPQ